MRRLGLITIALVLAVSSAAHAEPGPPADPDSPGSRAAPAASEHRAAQAQAALAEVEALFAGTPVGARTGHSGRDATMALRDLVVLRSSLTGQDRAAADAVLGRPTDGSSEFAEAPKYGAAPAFKACGTNVCVHYVKTGPHAVDHADTTPVNGIPDYVDTTLGTMELIHTTYVGAGYRAPKADTASTNNGGDARADIYLGDIGEHFYGYCTSDDPNFGPGTTYQYFDASAFCVLDEDYEEFPARTPLENLQVTAAHEYFHAVQFAYDFFEDSWIMEATAAWVEDEVYDEVNDNRQYLPESPLKTPWVSLDDVAGVHEYGDWIFFRHLSERFPTETGTLPNIVQEIWLRMDGSPASPDPVGHSTASLWAIRSELAQRGAPFAPLFSRFGAINRHPARSYEEGSAYPASPVSRIWRLTRGARSTGARKATLNHLASTTVRLTPDSSLRAADWRVQLRLDLPDRFRGSAATVQVYFRSGALGIYPITLNSAGVGSKTFPFAVGRVRFVEVTLTNASTRFTCWRSTAWSCQGNPLDNGKVFNYRATAYRS